MSSLPLAQFCGASAALGAIHGAGRSAALGSAFHAVCAGVDAAERDARLARLTPEELDEIASWKKPIPWTLPDGTVLDYEHAQREQTLALDVNGAPCDEDHPDCLTVGHYDMGWHIGETVYIGDIKRSVWTTSAGANSLQLKAYGYAAALKVGAQFFQCGIWAATEGVWKWGPKHDVTDFSTAELAATIIASARAPGDEYVLGSHCEECYGRLHCKEYLLPVANTESVLAPMAEPGGITHENAPEMLRMVLAASKLLERARDNLEAFAEKAGGIRDGAGKIWKHVHGKEEGERFNAAKFKLENPDIATKYIETTPPKNMGFRFVKEAKT